MKMPNTSKTQLPPPRFQSSPRNSQPTSGTGSKDSNTAEQLAKSAAATRRSILGYRLMIMSIPLLAVTSVVLYKRLVLGEEQRKQIGIITETGEIIPFADMDEGDERRPKN
ncbi:uncharacterized protein V1516DRAFT_689079 [Lipomyces oligophaga]|uniref:uncharacterized protein n=1 Tax=Lipomyces oligophaga TaxID=45792 RepID=UPI0034CFBD19